MKCLEFQSLDFYNEFWVGAFEIPINIPYIFYFRKVYSKSYFVKYLVYKVPLVQKYSYTKQTFLCRLISIITSIFINIQVRLHPMTSKNRNFLSNFISKIANHHILYNSCLNWISEINNKKRSNLT